MTVDPTLGSTQAMKGGKAARLGQQAAKERYGFDIVAELRADLAKCSVEVDALRAALRTRLIQDEVRARYTHAQLAACLARVGQWLRDLEYSAELVDPDGIVAQDVDATLLACGWVSMEAYRHLERQLFVQDNSAALLRERDRKIARQRARIDQLERKVEGLLAHHRRGTVDDHRPAKERPF